MAAMAVPIIPGKLDVWKAWVKDLEDGRKAEFDDFHRRMGLTAHRVWLTESPQGPMAIVVTDGPGADALMGKLAQSDHAFDTWFREKVSEIHGFDFSAPPEGPPPQSYIDWRAD
jgi:hypothetical protein